ncbi:hypothetical protein SDC9_198234 [bioreactor metagenome]|uniref:Uncharacterized protein n=1 Tax=bioreactor metagenome TaxID=1076179 RepID=A0A645ITY4_9ZZZZ
MQGNAVGNGRHGKFADAEMQVGARAVFLGEILLPLHQGVVGRREVRAAAHDVGQFRGQAV